MSQNLNSILIHATTPIREAMQVIELAPRQAGVAGMAVVVDEARRLQGVVTDGDIRSAILRGINLSNPVGEIMSINPIAVRDTLPPSQMYASVLSLIKETNRMLDRDAGKIIVTSEDGQVVDVVSMWSLVQQADIKSKRVAVIGLGFVGLTLAVVLADAGFQVLGVEARTDVVESLNSGQPHFFEAGLASRIRFHIGRNMKVVSSLESEQADVYIISVGTPVDNEHQPKMDFVELSARQIGRVLKRGDVVMLRSTIPVGISRNFVLPILERESGLKGGKEFSLVFAPERTIAGKAIKELRILPQVIGSLDQKGAEISEAIFRELTPTIVMVESLEAAEMVKLINNSFRDLVFSFANEIALVCERWGLDVFEIIQAANEGYPRDPIPLPSPGVGGVCLKKDPYLLLASALASGHEPKLIGRSRLVNEYMPLHVFQKFISYVQSLGRQTSDMEVLVVGFAFKGWPETSDMRDSATLELVEKLHATGVKIRGYDPVVSAEEMGRIPGVTPTTLADGFKGVDCVFVMNNHPSYENWNLYALLDSMARPGMFFDGWHIFRDEEILKVPGLQYASLSVQKNHYALKEKEAVVAG